MKRSDFQRHVSDRIVDELNQEEESVTVERLQELARRALELSDSHEDEIPDEDVERLLAEYPEFRTLKEGKGGPESPETPGSGLGMRR